MPTAVNIGKAHGVRGNWQVKWFPVTASQTFVAGDWVYLTSGALSICATANNAVTATYPLGKALADAVDVLDTNLPAGERLCPVLCPMADGEWLTQVYHGTGASAVITDDNIGTPLTLPLRNQAGQWVVNLEANSTNDRFVLIERYQDHSATETYPWVWVRLMQAARIEGAS